ALTGHRLQRIHVIGVDVGQFLAIDLHGDEPVVEQRGERLVLEGLVGHDVAPMAGGVPDRDQEGHVPAGRLGEGVLRPHPPVDGIVGVLWITRHVVRGEHEVISVTTAGAAHDDTAPAALSDAGVSTTVVAFAVFIAAWIGAKLTAFSVPPNGAGGSDLSLLQLALFLLAGAAALVTGRSLKPVPRSVFIVLTALYSVASGLIPIADLAEEAPVADIGLFTALTLFVFIADLL